MVLPGELLKVSFCTRVIGVNDAFSKMHGLGNDFMVVDAVTQKSFFHRS